MKPNAAMGMPSFTQLMLPFSFCSALRRIFPLKYGQLYNTTVGTLEKKSQIDPEQLTEDMVALEPQVELSRIKGNKSFKQGKGSATSAPRS